MQNDPGTEWTRLTRLYADKSDEELLDFATDFGNLTDTAQTVLRDELRKRKLGTPEQSASAQLKEQPTVFGRWSKERGGATKRGDLESGEDRSAEHEEAPVEYSWKTELCDCETSEEASRIDEVLRRARIQCWTDRRGTSFGTRSVAARGIRIMVAADELEEARAVIAMPIPQEVIHQVKEESQAASEDFVPPTCPKCRAEDPLLESIDPTNTWHCENCGATWTDPAPVENEGPNPS